MAPLPRTRTAATSARASAPTTSASARRGLRRSRDRAVRGAEVPRLGALRRVPAGRVALPALHHHAAPVVLAVVAPLVVHAPAHHVARAGIRLVEAECVADLLVAE